MSILTRVVLYKLFLYTFRLVNRVSLYIFVAQVATLTGIALYILCGHFKACRTIQTFTVHGDTLTHVVLYKFLLYTLLRWHMSYSTDFHCTRRHMSWSTTFDCPGVHSDICRTVLIFIVDIYTIPLVVLQKLSSYPNPWRTCRTVQIFLDTCPLWHQSDCTNFHFSRVHAAKSHTVHIFVVLWSTWTRVGQCNFWFSMCPRRPVSYSGNFRGTRVYVDTCRTVELMVVHVSTLRPVVVWKCLRHRCPWWHVSCCTNVL